MKRKRLVIILITLVLSISIIGCGSDNKKEVKENVTKTEAAKKEVITPTKEKLFALGKKQTQDIKEIAEKYKITTEILKSEPIRAQLQISQDENDLREAKQYKGYQIRTANSISINDGNQNKYRIEYDSTYDTITQKSLYKYSILIQYSLDDFKINNAQMMKDLILALHDGNYDFNGFDKWINDCMKGNSDESFKNFQRDSGGYHEKISRGLSGDKNIKSLEIEFTLRK